MTYPNNISIRGIQGGHVQGIATDKDRKYMYYSFTTCLIKTDMEGNLVGSVKGLAGHLGCIAYNEEDGRVYGSLEFKHDSIGSAILQRISEQGEVDVADGFYTAIFDVEKIDRMDMDAEKDGIMTAVYLNEVFDDYDAAGHRYGCSGIDGMTFAPMPGCNEKKYLYVSYGIYTDLQRSDNDHQVILRYDIADWKQFERPLNQENMHHVGPAKPDSKYFVYTGNTHYGIQNLEYDPKTGWLFAAVYEGRKAQFPNYPMYVIDLQKAAEYGPLKGLAEQGETLSLADFGLYDKQTGIHGLNFPYGSTGMISLGDGYFYFSRDFREEDGWGTCIGLYKLNDSGFMEQ